MEVRMEFRCVRSIAPGELGVESARNLDRRCTDEAALFGMTVIQEISSRERQLESRRRAPRQKDIGREVTGGPADIVHVADLCVQAGVLAEVILGTNYRLVRGGIFVV